MQMDVYSSARRSLFRGARPGFHPGKRSVAPCGAVSGCDENPGFRAAHCILG